MWNHQPDFRTPHHPLLIKSGPSQTKSPRGFAVLDPLGESRCGAPSFGKSVAVTKWIERNKRTKDVVFFCALWDSQGLYSEDNPCLSISGYCGYAEKLTAKKHWFVGTPSRTIWEDRQHLSILSHHICLLHKTFTKHLNVEIWGCVNVARVAINTCEILQQQTRILFAGLKSCLSSHRREKKGFCNLPGSFLHGLTHSPNGLTDEDTLDVYQT